MITPLWRACRPDCFRERGRAKMTFCTAQGLPAMETIEFQNPRMAVLVSASHMTRMFVWDHDPGLSSEALYKMLRPMRVHTYNRLMFQCNLTGMALRDLRLGELTTGAARSLDMRWLDSQHNPLVQMGVMVQRFEDMLELEVSTVHAFTYPTSYREGDKQRIYMPWQEASQAYEDALKELAQVREALGRITPEQETLDWEAWSSSFHGVMQREVLVRPAAPASALWRILRRSPRHSAALWRRGSVPPELFERVTDPAYWTPALVRLPEITTSLLERIAEHGPPDLQALAHSRLTERRFLSHGFSSSFGELRSMLHAATEGAWAEAAKLLGLAWRKEPEVARATWVPYVRRVTQDWPEDVVRAVPEAWMAPDAFELWSLANAWTLKEAPGEDVSAWEGDLHLGEIRTLRLMFDGVSRAWLDVLATSPMPALHTLEVVGPAPPLEAGPWLEASWWSGVRALSWSGVALSEPIAASLAKALGGLEELTVQNAGLDAVSLTTLLGGAWVRHVRAWTFARNDLGDALLALRDAQLDALTSLAFHRESLTPEVLRALLGAPWAAQLEHLDISNTSLGEAAVDVLWEHAGHLQALRSVWVTGLSGEAKERLQAFLSRDGRGDV